jgi:phosphatidylserine/phosphatidylglycerophosphate/cardiolipin synthase-like enzyme
MGDMLRAVAREHYAPEERLDRIDAELINNAEASVDIAAFVLSDWEVIDALDNAAPRGVKVRVILDPRQHSDIGRMVGLDIRQKRPATLQHLKAYAIDGQILREGSENFSHSAPSQDNSLIVFRDPAVVAKFEAHFASMWAAAISVVAVAP